MDHYDNEIENDLERSMSTGFKINYPKVICKSKKAFLAIMADELEAYEEGSCIICAVFTKPDMPLPKDIHDTPGSRRLWEITKTIKIELEYLPPA